MSEIRVINARYWVKSEHTVLDKSAHALREGRLLGIKQELSDMMKADVEGHEACIGKGAYWQPRCLPRAEQVRLYLQLYRKIRRSSVGRHRTG
jgi:hypothetical protein